MQQESPKDMRWFIPETLWRSIPLILPGVILKQFTARDIISKWDVIEVQSSATAKTAEEFLCTLRDRTPFSIRAIQVDACLLQTGRREQTEPILKSSMKSIPQALLWLTSTRN
jgi:hypothetical protein